MTDREGKPIVDDDGKRWSRGIPANCTPQQIAARMAEELRIKFRSGERASGF